MLRKISSIKLLLVIILPSAILMLSPCYPDDSISPTETDIVVTNYYDSVTFSNYSNYYMPDTILPLDTASIPKDQPKALILGTIATNMESMGYTRIDGSDTTITPHLVVIASSIITKNISVYYWYPYYGPGWGWGGWGYPGWGYPGYYPPVPYVTSYTTGTLRIEMFNPSDIRVIDNDTIHPVYWMAGINGVLQGSNIDSRIKSTIDQAFKQSPELKTGN